MKVQSFARRAAVLVFAASIVLSGAAHAQRVAKVTVAYGQPSIYNAPMWIAKDRGFFEKYGLDAEVVQLLGTRITQGLLAGSVQFVSSTASSTFIAKLRGGDTLLVANGLTTVPQELVVSARIKEAKDLRGRIGAISLQSDFSTTALRYALKSLGLDAAKDVTMVQGFATDADRLGALISGSADFTILNVETQPQYQKAGMRRMFALKDLGDQLPFIMSGYFTTGAYARQNPAAVRAYLQAIAEALHYFHTNRKGSVDIIVKYTKRSAPDVDAYMEYYDSIMLKTPEISDASVRASLEVIAAAEPDMAKTNAKSYYDASYVDALGKSGFFNKVWGK